MSFIEIKNIKKSFGDLTAVNDVSFTVDEGEVFGLLGPNGAGKSTLISIMTTLVKPDAGDVVINGYDLRKQTMEIKKILGLVPQEIALYPTLSAKENLAFWGRMYGIGGSLLKERIDDALEIAGLKDRAKDRIEKYSGGMKRRINIAAALLHRPKLLIMDEPTVGIDPQSRNHILETVVKLNKEGMTVIYTSHYMEEVEFLCSRIGIMDHGKVIASGTKEELRKLIGDFDTINLGLVNPKDSVISGIKSIKGVQSVSVDEGSVSVIAKEADSVLAKVISLLDSEKCKIHSVNIEHSNLESVFLHLTGRALRD
ncbi:MAG TPA: ABC transporter ATP-binding protein [Clostridia bacterium]|nr:ABC transporter ATP-binding protein [Clostridia bacterium]